MLCQHDVRLGKPIGEAVLHHSVRALSGFLGRLEKCDGAAFPVFLVLGEDPGGAHEPSNMHVVPARMGDASRLTEAVAAGRGARIGEAGRFRDRQGVHVGAQQHGRSVAIPKDSDHARLPDAGGHLIALFLQPIGGDPRRPLLLHRQLGMGVKVLVDPLQFENQGVRRFERQTARSYACPV
jgi:hypothetical protein